MLDEAISQATRDAADREKLAVRFTDFMISKIQLFKEELRSLYVNSTTIDNKQQLIRAIAKVWFI